MALEYWLSHPELESSSGPGQSMPILESDLPYLALMVAPDGSINSVSCIRPLRFSGTRHTTIPPSGTGCRSTNCEPGPMSDPSSDVDRFACLRAIPISRPACLLLLGFLICRLVFGMSWSRRKCTSGRLIRYLQALCLEISFLASPALVIEALLHGELGTTESGGDSWD
jgi:hypothetical protein